MNLDYGLCIQVSASISALLDADEHAESKNYPTIRGCGMLISGIALLSIARIFVIYIY